jgi:hypothetical protein
VLACLYGPNCQGLQSSNNQDLVTTDLTEPIASRTPILFGRYPGQITTQYLKILGTEAKDRTIANSLRKEKCHPFASSRARTKVGMAADKQPCQLG